MYFAQQGVSACDVYRESGWKSRSKGCNSRQCLREHAATRSLISSDVKTWRKKINMKNEALFTHAT